mmetsp:Transcript_100719/g.285450  ORF Transcript_100719/g.285450 Transcript_100719/m.285450 type:complete len:296 (-) Transcript_100719:175-1062(-)
MAKRAQPPRPRLRSALLVAVAVAASLTLLGHRHGADVAEEAEPQLTFLGSQTRKVTKAVQAAFPGAVRGAEVKSRVLQALKPYGVGRSNVVYGQSVCSDEINSDPGHVTTLLSKHYGKTFFVGGIGGAPYVGKTGFGAFSGHVPDGGHVVLLFGPHIGFSPTGEAGKFLRTGQGQATTSCGAVIAAYGQCTGGSNMPADPDDLEQSWLRTKLKPHCAGVAKSKQPMVDLVMKAYEVIEQEVFKIVNTNFGTGNLILIGGIQINMPYPTPGFWMPMHFSIRTAGKEPEDLMTAFQL